MFVLRLRVLLLILFTLSFLLPPFGFGRLRAETNVSYLIIRTDTVWTKEGSPYVIDGADVFIGAGSKLTIEEGVVVKIRRAGIYSYGEIDARGTAEDPVIFTSYNDDTDGSDLAGSASRPAPGDWGGIVVESGKISLTQTIVRYGGTNYDNSYVRGGIIRRNSALARSDDSCGAIIHWSGELRLNRSLIAHNVIGIQSIGKNADIEISESIIDENVEFGIKNESGEWECDDETGDCRKITSPSIKALNNWWGDESGPSHPEDNPFGMGEKIIGKVEFDPWIGKPEPLKPKNPVIIVPGIISSRLNKNVPGMPEVWPNLDGMMVLADDSYLYDLDMNEAGWPVQTNIKPTDILRSVGPMNIYDGLISDLEQAGYEEGRDLFVFAYDWRLSVSWIAGGSPVPNTATLKDKIDEALLKTGAEKVDIIAHSMGGLVAKAYMHKYGKGKVDKFIDIATPHLGSPKALKMLMFGDDMGFGFFFLGANQNTMKEIAQNMSSIFDLLPTRQYQSLPDNDYAYYVADLHDYDNDGAKGNLDYEQMKGLFGNVGLNRTLFERSEVLHQTIDRLDVDGAVNIIGCGKPTIGKIYLLNREDSGKFEYGLKYINGDGTVPLRSADALDAERKYFIQGGEHGFLPNSRGVRSLAVSALQGDLDSFDAGQFPSIKNAAASCSFSGRAVSFHSPLEIHVYDKDGNHAGPVGEGAMENDIEGLSYDLIEDNKFLFVPAGLDALIEGKGLEQGSFNARIETIEDGEYKDLHYFNGIPLLSGTKISLDPEAGEIDYDYDGDGKLEKTVRADAVLPGGAEDLVKPATEARLSGTLGRDGWHISPVGVELASSDPENGSGVLKTEYKLDNGEWTDYTGPFEVEDEGIHELIYRSTDKVGNVEEEKSAVIKIDTEPPVIADVYPADSSLLHSETVPVLFMASDAVSGVATDSISIYLDSSLVSGSEIDLFDFSLGTHTLEIAVRDQAGNASAHKQDIFIIATIASSISDIERLFSGGHIKKESVKSRLIGDLKKIADFEEKYSEGKEGIGARTEKAVEKCKEKHGISACEKIYTASARMESVLNKLSDLRGRIIGKSALLFLEVCRKLQWVDEFGYGIIKENLTYILM